MRPATVITTATGTTRRPRPSFNYYEEEDGMNTVKVNKDELLKELHHNRDGHRALFEEAQVGFRERLIQELDRRLADAKRGLAVEQYIGLPVPQDHTKDYDRIIKMVEMSVDEVMELTQTEFAQFVMDDFAWQREFVDTANAYGAGLAH